jgi:hypothetical protein
MFFPAIRLNGVITRYTKAETLKCYKTANIWKMKKKNYSVGFEVLSAATMKDAIFWDITKCDPLKSHQRFGALLATCFLLFSVLT